LPEQSLPQLKGQPVPVGLLGLYDGAIEIVGEVASHDDVAIKRHEQVAVLVVSRVKHAHLVREAKTRIDRLAHTYLHPECAKPPLRLRRHTIDQIRAASGRPKRATELLQR
jgi:hypothetical protein